MASLPSAPARERRVDVLRGIALVCLFIDHTDGDWLNWLTLRNFGFSDAAELFVMLSGFASMVAFGRSFARDGASAGLRRIAFRCLRLYVFQIGMLLITLLTVWLWTSYYHLTSQHFAPLLYGGVAGIARGLTLQAQPSNLNILPLYIVLLAIFPVIYAGLRYRPKLTVALSGAIWLAANLAPELNFTNTLDNTGWYLNPFAWQFLFVLGAVLARLLARSQGVLPRLPWLLAACWLLLGFGFLQSFPWQQWGLPNLALLASDAPDKTTLAPLRLLHVLALVYVVLTWEDLRALLRYAVPAAIECMGRHSLEVYSLATVLALFGKLAFHMYGDTWLSQLLVNMIGLGAMLALARGLDREPRRAAPARLPSATELRLHR